MPVPPYPAPARPVRRETEIQRSRFIATVGSAASVQEAREFIAGVSREFRDATHNCWAYVVGPPGDTSRVGMSDAGEPRGTAGRSMLKVLLGSGVGDVVAVVTRYYGGVKLGTGGLARAYAGAVMAALEDLEVVERVATVNLSIVVTYGASAALRHILAACDATVLGETYAADITLAVRVPIAAESRFRESLGALHGQARVVAPGAG